MLLPVTSSSNKVKTEQEKTRVKQQGWCPSCSSKDFFLWDLQYFFVISVMLFPAQFSTSCALTAHCTWKLLFDKNWQPLAFWKGFFCKWDFILICLLNFFWCKRRWKWTWMSGGARSTAILLAQYSFRVPIWGCKQGKCRWFVLWQAGTECTHTVCRQTSCHQSPVHLFDGKCEHDGLNCYSKSVSYWSNWVQNLTSIFLF